MSIHNADAADRERDYILRAAEHAPAIPRTSIPRDLNGWWTPQGFYVCAVDAARIIERGCSLPTGSTPVYVANPRGVCIVCQRTELARHTEHLAQKAAAAQARGHGRGDKV